MPVKEAAPEPEKPKPAPPVPPPTVIPPPAPQPVMHDLDRPFESAPVEPADVEQHKEVIEDPLAKLRKTPIKTGYTEAPVKELRRDLHFSNSIPIWRSSSARTW